MKLDNATVLVTGANRGLGRSLVTASLAAGARKVYAGARNLAQLEPLVAVDPRRIIPLSLDITDAGSLRAAAARATDLNVLINNAGVLAGFNVLTTDPAELARDFGVNVFGTIAATRAFLPALEQSRGALINILSIASFAGLPALGGYAAAKAASYSITQALRSELANKGVAVYGVFPGPIDTDMVRGMDAPKTSPDAVAQAILEDVAREVDEIFPDPASRQMIALWRSDARALERQFAAM